MMGTTPNRGYVYPAEWDDDWFATFQTLMEAIDTDMADIQVGVLIDSIKIKVATPNVRLVGTEASGKDWRLVESAGSLEFQRNDGTENSPTWTMLFKLAANGDLTVNTVSAGVILTAANSAQFRVGVDNDGAITSTPV